MNLNEIELKLLMQKVMQPDKSKRTAAFYKRRQRDKAREDILKHGAPVTAETMDHALLDALAEILRSGDPDGVVASVINCASAGFRCPAQAQIRITNRSKKRLSKILVAKIS